MTIHAYKYQGAGNDFVILDNRTGQFNNISPKLVNRLCDRRFGVGADGLMLLGKSNKYDFSMRYFNADGPEGTMCGNGGRCLVAFALKMGFNEFEFDAIDGTHNAQIIESKGDEVIVRLKMIDISNCSKFNPSTGEKPDAYFLNTGSPHYVEFVEDINNYDVATKGKYWRYHPDFAKGTNVNFVQIMSTSNGHGDLSVRTYERGVEAETFACGTGVTASAIATFVKTIGCNRDEAAEYAIKALGGKLSVSFNYNKETNSFSNVYLTGPATFVFETDIELNIEL